MNAQDTSAKIPTIYKNSIQVGEKIDVEVREKEKWAREDGLVILTNISSSVSISYNRTLEELHEEMKTRHPSSGL